MSILHLIPSVGPRSFGLGPVALHLTKEQNILGSDAVIWSLDSQDDLRWAAESSHLSVNQMRRFSTNGPHHFGLSFELERVISSEWDKIALIHQHGLWSALSRATGNLRIRHKIPSVVTPHGLLEKWALKKSWMKKKIALALYERRNLHSASCLHAVADNEVADFRNFGLSNPIAVIPNGISLDWLNSIGDAGAFRQEFNIPCDKRILLFLSRITPKKGLPMLLTAIDGIKKIFSDWLFVIAGEDEFGHQSEIELHIKKLGLENSVIFTGPLFYKNKRDAFAAAEICILPSYSEGAPIVILESLGAGVPVIATKASPWQNLETYSCGWWPDISTQALVESLKIALVSSPETLKSMGQKGKDLVSDKYTWVKSARMTIELYEWLMGKGQKPDFVILD